ncbi:ABC transporter substrate-binding protein [Paenibacillus sp. MMS20-IR301]|uniref:ABC transporter substrate-binding protein n=1 Tax=Paenibacillus sp. MMS20-IR301 TaxID=2895946 RepID=UPI0028E4B5C7|nr:ABC transporter substrate-binding protein [Paenibacillus sp. MMS20-IR301]WNS46954.1 ABC transporter substrate-binding protein [Paenibacillus sp. MMS20-IR301]
MKTVSMVLAVSLALLGLAGCGGNNNGGGAAGGNTAGSNSGAAETKAKDPVTISFVIPNTVDTAPFSQLFSEYEQQTGNKVELQALPGGEFDNMMKTRFSTGDFPDLFLMQPGTKQYVKLRADEMLREWSGDSDVWARIIPSMKEAQTLDGKIYGVPYGATGMYGVFYNKDVFAKAGVEPPKNYAGLIEIAQTIKAAGVTPFYEGVKDGWPAQIFYLTGWVSNVDPAIGDEGVAKLQNNALKMNEIPQLKELFVKQKELIDLGLYQDNVLAGTYDEMQTMLGEGKAAMAFNLDGIIPQLEKKFGKEFVNDKLGFFPFPTDTDEGVALVTPPNQLMIPVQAKHADAAAELVKFMLTQEMTDLYYKAAPGIPIFENAAVELVPVQQTVKELIDAGKSRINIQNRLTPVFADFQKLLQIFFINGDVDKAFNDFSANYEKDGKSKLLEGFK